MIQPEKLPFRSILGTILGLLSVAIAPVIYFMFSSTYTKADDVPKVMTILVYASFFFGVIGGSISLPYLIVPGQTKSDRMLGAAGVLLSLIGCAAVVSAFSK